MYAVEVAETYILHGFLPQRGGRVICRTISHIIRICLFAEPAPFIVVLLCGSCSVSLVVAAGSYGAPAYKFTYVG
jgi:hypothetical protein